MMVLAGIGGLGAPELMIILVIVVVLFGSTKLAGIGSSLGQGIREFRKATKDPEEEERKRQEEERKRAEEAGRYTAAATPPPAPSANGAATEVRSGAPASAPPQSTVTRPPDFTG